ncbi:MFS transporter [Schleiferilactobacillus harbinensis]|uniref:MFS transporter n=1 Tax=Schleiferilactobacillus harbinensis TaxID=304207 RepID=UPI00117210EF|nr:MFS transporter [Schleiferilactobacillus harbinensis]GEK06435.1 MFS transporter [Schleiferilactobacillus harbinensis]
MTSFKVRSFVLILLAFVLGCSEFIIVGVLDDISTELHVGVSTVGYLVTIFALVYAVSTPFVTSAVGQHTLYRFMLFLMGIFIIGNVLSAVAFTYPVLVVSRIITAIVSGPLISIALTFANYIAPISKKAWLISWVFSGFSIASVFGVPLGTWIATAVGWRMSFVAIVVVSVLTMALIAFSLPRDLRQRRRVPTAGQEERRDGVLALFKDRRIQIGMMMPMLSLAGVYVVYTYLRPILSRNLGFTTNVVTIMLFIFGIMSLISNQLSGRLADNDGLLKMPKIFGAELVLMLLMPLALTNRVTGLIALMLMGVVMYLINSPIQMHFLGVAERDYPQAIVMASSLNSIFANFGIALGSATGGLIVDHLSMRVTGFGGAVYILAALLLVIWLNRVNKQAAEAVPVKQVPAGAVAKAQKS